MTSAPVLGVDFESQAGSQAVVVILYWQLSLQVGVVLLVDRRRPCQTCELGLSSSSWLNQKWRFSEAGWLSFSLRLRVMLRFSGPVARAGYCLPRYVVVDLRTTISVATSIASIWQIGCGSVDSLPCGVRVPLLCRVWWLWCVISQ
ncbi:hypothetical protein Bca4012_099599 [Brassica carinata]